MQRGIHTWLGGKERRLGSSSVMRRNTPPSEAPKRRPRSTSTDLCQHRVDRFFAVLVSLLEEKIHRGASRPLQAHERKTVNEVIRGTTSKKAVAPDKLPAELIKLCSVVFFACFNGDHVLLRQFYAIIRNIWQSGDPLTWTFVRPSLGASWHGPWHGPWDATGRYGVP